MGAPLAPTQPTDKVGENLGHHHELVTSIRELDYVPDSLRTNEAELKTAKDELAAATAAMKKNKEEQESTYKDLQSIKGSSAARLLVKIRHPRKHDAVIACQTVQREHQYESAFSEGQECFERLENARAAVDTLETTVGDLTQLAVRRTELQGEVKVLLKEIFDGPTPNYPEEDEAENAMVATGHQVEELKGNLEYETRILAMYGQILEQAERAARQFDKARHARRNQQNGHSRRHHHTSKAKRCYEDARMMEAALVRLKPSVPLFPGDLPESSWFNVYQTIYEREDHCRGFVTHLCFGRAESQRVIASLTAQLNAAIQHHDLRTNMLLDLRCKIMYDRTRAAGMQPYDEQSDMSTAPPVYA